MLSLKIGLVDGLMVGWVGVAVSDIVGVSKTDGFPGFRTVYTDVGVIKEVEVDVVDCNVESVFEGVGSKARTKESSNVVGVDVKSC